MGAFFMGSTLKFQLNIVVVSLADSICGHPDVTLEIGTYAVYHCGTLIARQFLLLTPYLFSNDHVL